MNDHLISIDENLSNHFIERKRLCDQAINEAFAKLTAGYELSEISHPYVSVNDILSVEDPDQAEAEILVPELPGYMSLVLERLATENGCFEINLILWCAEDGVPYEEASGAHGNEVGSIEEALFIARETTPVAAR